MNTWLWVRRSLTFHARSHAAVACGVAVAVAVLAGAMLVGASVEASLRGLVTQRLGSTEHVLAAQSFFREDLAESFPQAAPLIAMEATVRNERTSARAGGITLYGVDERFYRFHSCADGTPPPRAARVTAALARELGVQPGDTLVLRFDSASPIPREFLQGRKDRPALALRVTTRDPVEASAPAEFSLRAQQGDVHAVFVPLTDLQRAIDQHGRVNTLLLAHATTVELERALRAAFRLEDLGVHLRPLAGGGVALEHASTLVPDAIAAGARRLPTEGVFSYLANAIRANGRTVPYSLITATGHTPGLILNEWAAQDLRARVGDQVTVDYFVWSTDGQLRELSAEFPLTRIVPIRGAYAARDYVPDYPGITTAKTLAGWDPPFPLDLSRVKPRDEEYWDRYSMTPKAWIPLADGQKLWGTRFGHVTSLRFKGDPNEFARKVRDELDPLTAGFTLLDVRGQNLASSTGSTDFGSYFVAFSSFLLVAALLLAALFFRLGIEQRTREIGLLRAIGLDVARLRGLFLREGLVVALAGALAGCALACLFGAGMLWGLRTMWWGAVGTSRLSLHVNPGALAGGAVSGLLAAAATLWATLRGLRDMSPTALLSLQPRPMRHAAIFIGWVSLAAGMSSVAAAGRKWLPPETGFFLGGALLLVAGLIAIAWLLRAGLVSFVAAPTALAVARLGARNAGWRPGRSILSLALIASAAFLLVSLESFRRHPQTGGPGLIAESQTPIFYDPNTDQGRENLNLQALPRVPWFSFRLRPGDDVSCLNLYQPRNPRVIGAPHDYLAHRWPLLEQAAIDGVVPAAIDRNSMQYILHKELGDVVVIEREGLPPVKLQLAVVLDDSVFQGELIISELNFLWLFPQQQGYRVFLIDAPAAMVPALEDALSDYGFDAQSVSEKLAAYHRVENAYLSAFQSLGGLGLLLGSAGLAAVLFRNALERRREIGLLRAVGWTRAATEWMLLSETLLLLAGGLVLGLVCALIAAAPVLAVRGFTAPLAGISVLLAAIFLTGLVSGLAAVRLAARSPLLDSLRSE